MAFLLREHTITTICFLNAHSIGHGIKSRLTPTLVVDQLLILDIVFCAQAVSRHATFYFNGWLHCRQQLHTLQSVNALGVAARMGVSVCAGTWQKHHLEPRFRCIIHLVCMSGDQAVRTVRTARVQQPCHILIRKPVPSNAGTITLLGMT